MSLENWIPLNITRSSRSYFDPSYDVGLDWDDFGNFHRRSGGEQRSRQYQLERKVSRMDNDMDRMFTNFYHLSPYERQVMKPRSPMTRRHLYHHATSDHMLTSPPSSSSSRDVMASSNLHVPAIPSNEVRSFLGTRWIRKLSWYFIKCFYLSKFYLIDINCSMHTASSSLLQNTTHSRRKITETPCHSRFLLAICLTQFPLRCYPSHERLFFTCN